MLNTTVKFLKAINKPAITLLLLLLLMAALQLYPPFQHFLAYGEKISVEELLYAAIWLAIAWLATALVEIFFWQRWIEKRATTKVPQLIKTILNIFIFLIIIILIMGYVFHQSIAGLIATTGAVSIILGLGLRSTIESIFNGIFLSIDPIYQIGDWVTLTPTIPNPARVVEMTWRYTIFQDTLNNHLIVPNNQISTSIVTNYSQPTPHRNFSIFFSICVPPQFIDRVKGILEAALRSSSILLDQPPPSIVISDIHEGYITYKLRYWFDITRYTLDQAKNDLYTKILHHFAIAGIGVDITNNGYRVQVVRMVEPEAMSETILRKIELFSELTVEEISELASRTERLEFKSGEVIIRQNEIGDAMYILAEGLLKVDLEDAERKITVTVAKILPGHFFGEMSLLVGDPRSATVRAVTDSIVYKITKETMQELFETHPHLVQDISQKIAERHVINLTKQKELLKKDVVADTQNYANLFYRMIKKWFWNE